jgi:hypothetical protein
MKFGGEVAAHLVGLGARERRGEKPFGDSRRVREVWSAV